MARECIKEKRNSGRNSSKENICYRKTKKEVGIYTSVHTYFFNSQLIFYIGSISVCTIVTIASAAHIL